ncbi:MAG TPA: PLP-dependent aminotransferase family protein [Streptosporangiaceae bacterium]|jgi:DNA-binding transcriptional MocR family regulator
MNDDSNQVSAVAAVERMVTSLPPGSRLPSYRELQQRYRLSPATVQRLLATLARQGLLVTRPGSGTYTAGARPRPAASPDVSWQTLALGSRAGLGPELERLIEPPPPDVLPLASGYLDETLQPLGLLAAAASRAARRPQGWSRLPAQGLPELRSHLAAETGAAMTAHNVLITPGGQAALSAAFRHLSAPGDPVIVESPTYTGALMAARAAGLTLVPVPADAGGIVPDALADALGRTGARLVYLQPRYANPAGAVLAPQRREQVLALLARHGAFGIEDDWVAGLDLGPPSPPPLVSMDGGGHVIYLRSLSKPVAAGLRVAGLAAAGPALTRLRRGRISDDLFVAPVLQQIALDVLTAPGWSRHLGSVRRALRERRDALAGAVAALAPGCQLAAVPGGGLHLWLRLPEGCSDAGVAAECAARGLAVTPGRSCFAGEPPGPYLRLSYAAAGPDALARAAGLLAGLLGAG